MSRDVVMSQIGSQASRPEAGVSEIETDVLIVGAGPCGLFATFELGMLGMRCDVVDVLDRPGGQCAELYPEKPIYDIPALPACSGQELIDNLLLQARPFEPRFHFGQMVEALSRLDDGRWRVRTNNGQSFIAGAVVIAAGAGCFSPRKLPASGAELHEGEGLLYAVRERERLRGKHLVVVGGGDSALDWALDLRDIAERVTLVHRRDRFRAAPDTVSKVRALIDTGAMDFRAGAVAELLADSGQLSGVRLQGGDQVVCDRVLAFFGLSARLGPLTSFGLDMHGDYIRVDTERFATSLDGVYAIGDVSWYPGKLRLILSGFHEAALMAHDVKRRLHPDIKHVFEHSTTAMKEHLSAR